MASLLSNILIIASIIVILVNFCTEIFKPIIKTNGISTRLLALIFSISMSVIATVAYCQINSIVLYWYIIIGSIIAGIPISYASMFGYDNLYGEFLNKIKELLL